MASLATGAAAAPSVPNQSLNPLLPPLAREIAAALNLGGVGRALRAGREIITEGKQSGVVFLIADGVRADGDANLLRVVLDNLLGNAWKYTAMREEAIIEFGATEIEGKSACYIRDNGAGFAMADADKLFLPFQRLAGAKEFRGHGIGLATVERMIRRHGGRLWAEGEPGKGATFYFTLGSAIPA